MSYKYTHFIPQNIAPKGAKRLIVYDSDGNEFHSIALGRLTPPTTNKLYSFGLLSDLHLWSDNSSWTANANTKFDNALSYFENKGCEFCVACGDLTQTGFYLRTVETDASTTYLDVSQMAKYKEICDEHTIPVYELCGNHESYYGMPISNNLALLETYTGKDELSYTVEQGDDLFIIISQPRDSWVMSNEDLTWLYETLETNRNKRCFVFVHPYIEEDSGDAMDVRENSIFEYWGATKKSVFMRLMAHYKNAILFHGHSHMKYECQELDKSANYTEKNGFKSVHVPSCSTPRNVDVVNNVSINDSSASEGAIVDVYDTYFVVNGIDFINSKPIALGTYKVNTPLQTIEADTFTDSTGTIVI